MIRSFDGEDIATSGEQFKFGREDMAQGVKNRLLMFFGEYFLDTDDGTPWFQSVLGKAPQNIAELVIKQRILSAPQVEGMTDFNYEYFAEERRIEIRAGITNAEGEEELLEFDEVIL